MQMRSSGFAPVTFLDVDGIVARLGRAAACLCADDRNVTAVVLFGSLAQRSATPGSDADLLVLLGHDARRVMDRVPDYTRHFEGLGLGVEVLPWTRDELADRLADGDPFATEIVRTGRMLAGELDGRLE